MCVDGGGGVSPSLLSHYPAPTPPLSHSLSLCLTAPYLQCLSLAWADGLVQFFSFCLFLLFVLVWLLGQNGPNVTVLEYYCFHILFLCTVCVVQDDTVVPCNGMNKVFCTLRTCMWICISWWWRHTVHLCVLYVYKTCVCVQLHPDGAI